MKREVIRGVRNLQGKKVIHSEVQISIYIISIYQVWFPVTSCRDNSVTSVSFSSPFCTHSQEPLSWAVCHIPKMDPSQMKRESSRWNSVGPWAGLHLGIPQPAGSQG